MSDEIQELKDEEQANMAEEAAVDDKKDSDNWIMGAVLVIVGGLFLLGNFLPGSFVTNWWAAFILIPALYSLNRARRSYKRNGRLTPGGRSSLIGGLLILTVAMIFLLGLDWGVVWPVFIIIIGLSILLQYSSRS